MDYLHFFMDFLRCLLIFFIFKIFILIRFFLDISFLKQQHILFVIYKKKKYIYIYIINRPHVAGAVLQIPLLLIHSLIH